MRLLTRYIFYFLVSTLIALYACNKDDGKSAGKGTCFSNTNSQSMVHDGVNREYILFIPDSYDNTLPSPVMLNFHGFGGSASDYMLDADMRSLAESEAFILVYPQGSCLDGLSHWNACPLGGDNKSTTDDFGFIEAIIDELSDGYNVDLDRIYAAGYSNGGMMAYGLANFKSDLIAAVASVSGTMLDCIGPTSHSMPVIHLHGTSDSVIPYNGNDDFNSAQDVLDHWIAFNNTTSSPTTNTDDTGGMTIEHFVYGQGDSNVSVEHYRYIEGNHIWFNSTFQDQTTAELIWNFVSRYDINGIR